MVLNKSSDLLNDSTRFQKIQKTRINNKGTENQMKQRNDGREGLLLD